MKATEPQCFDVPLSSCVNYLKCKLASIRHEPSPLPGINLMIRVKCNVLLFFTPNQDDYYMRLDFP